MGTCNFCQDVYRTTFPATENPLSSNRWLNGNKDGTNWLDVRATPGKAFATDVSPSPPYNDPTAILTGAWGRTQTVEARVIAPSTSSQNQEIEARLMTVVTAGRIVGYEVLFSVTSNPYVDIERWDGGSSLADFFSVTGGSTTGPQPLTTGNRVKATITPNGLITAFADYGSTSRALGDPTGYQQVASGTDTKYCDGAPGIGMFQHGGSTASLVDFCVSEFLARSS